MGGIIQPIISKSRLVELYRPLVGAEDKLADVLLLAVSGRIRGKAADQGVTLDESDSEVELVVFESVAAVLDRGNYRIYSSITLTTDDATESRVFANALATLEVTDAQWRRLGLDPDTLSASPRGTFPVGDY